MPKFSSRSKERLDTCHKDLVTLFNEVIKDFDCTVVYGHRTPDEQFELYKKGRKEIYGKWVVKDRKKIVTYKDGHEKKSKHNEFPSLAVDVAPYPIEWSNTDRMYYFAGWVMGLAERLKDEGKITNDIVFGGDWDDDTKVKDQSFMDLVHFQIK